VLLAILTADCVPVLLVDPRRRVWPRSTPDGVARMAAEGRRASVRALRLQTAELLAAIGPGRQVLLRGGAEGRGFRDAWRTS
jgi:hypothetical protein